MHRPGLLKLEHFQKLIFSQPHGTAAYRREFSPKSGEAAEMENNISWLLHIRAFFSVAMRHGLHVYIAVV